MLVDFFRLICTVKNQLHLAFEAAWVLDLADKQTTLKIIFLVKILWNRVLFCGSKVKNQLQPTPTGPLKPFFAYFWRTSKAFSWRFMSRKLSFLTQLHSANTIHSCQKRAWKGDNSLNLSSKKIENHQVWPHFFYVRTDLFKKDHVFDGQWPEQFFWFRPKKG